MKWKKISVLTLILLLNSPIQISESSETTSQQIKCNKQYSLENVDSKISEEQKNRDDLVQKIIDETGLSVISLTKITCNISFYSSLACENGTYGLKTASGVNMNSKTVANNHLPFGTNLYIEGYGHKVVHDTGNETYFKTIHDFDVYVPRLPNEDDMTYYERVNNMGRKQVVGYIIEKAE